MKLRSRYLLTVYQYILTEADGSKAEIDESLDTLQTLGFTVNQDMTTGEKDWLGSMLVLTK